MKSFTSHLASFALVALSLSLTAVTCLGLILATERQAHAYIDPGSGLLALQSAGAALAAVGYFLRRRIGALFGKKSADSTPAPIAPAAVPVAINKDTSRAA